MKENRRGAPAVVEDALAVLAVDMLIYLLASIGNDRPNDVPSTIATKAGEEAS